MFSLAASCCFCESDKTWNLVSIFINSGIDRYTNTQVSHHIPVEHGSAGVGRTGTMISIDTLIQTVEEEGDLNIFETVLELRKQRINMVQTEKQYFYIYTCIKEFIENPLLSIYDKNSLNEPLYENLNTIRGCIESTLLEQESESAL